MEYIKKFDEYINGCDGNINTPLFKELNSEQEGIVYKTYYPKENQDDNIYIRDNKKMLWDFFDNGYKYAKLKGFHSCRNPKSLMSNTSCLKVAMFNNIIVQQVCIHLFKEG